MTSIQSFTLSAAGEVDVEVIDAAQVTILGPAAGKQYVRLPDGREAEVGTAVRPWDRGNPPIPGEIHLRKLVPSERHVGPSHTVELIRGKVVEAGSYDRAQARDQAKAAAKTRRANPPLQAVDALTRFPLLQARAAELVRLEEPMADPTIAALSRTVKAVSIPARQQVRGFDGILRLIEQEARLELVGDPPRLLLRAKAGRLSQDIAQLVTDLEEFLLAVKLGDPIRCALSHPKGKAPPAVTVAVPSVPVCSSHLDEELRP